jgi:hypothetical protein
MESRDDAAPALAGMGHGVAGKVYATALPGSAEHARHRCLDAFMSVRDDELHAAQATPRQTAQEVSPERLRLRGADRHAEHLSPAVAVQADRIVSVAVTIAVGLADLQVRRVDPDIGPVTFDGPI